jgi:predicted nucleic acid-binding Zn ribbon protein
MRRPDLKTRANKAVSLKDEIDVFIKYIGLDERMQELQIVEVWEQCVGNISKFSKPVELRKDKLFISVESATWRYELSAKREEIISKLNKCLKKNLIKEIIFV